MTVKELQVIHEVLWSAKETIRLLTCEAYPYTEFEDKDFEKMFYALNDMCIEVSAKQDELKNRKEQKK